MLCIGIVQCCFQANAYKTLNEPIILLSKRRSQLKKVGSIPVLPYWWMAGTPKYSDYYYSRVSANVISTCNFGICFCNINLVWLLHFLLSQAIVGMVQESMTYVEKVSDIETRIELISTLNSVTAGKVRQKRVLLTMQVSCTITHHEIRFENKVR